MLKLKLNKTQFDALEGPIQALYKADGEDYLLQVESDGNGDAKFNAERSRRRAAETKADDAEKERDKALEQLGAKNTDVKAVEESYKVKLKAQKDLTDEATKTHTNYVRNELIGKEATKIAGELSKVAPGLLANALKDRFDVDFTDLAAPTLYIKDAAGKRSAATLDDLRKEVRDNPDYKGILVGSQATGGIPSKPTNAQPSRGFTGRDVQSQQQQPSVVGRQPSTASILDRVNARRAAAGQEVVEPVRHGTQ